MSAAHRYTRWLVQAAVAALLAALGAAAVHAAGALDAAQAGPPLPGGVRLADVLAALLFFPAGMAAAAFACRARAAEAAARRYREVLEAAADGVLGTDGEGRVAFVSGGAAALLGYAPGELLGRPVKDVLVPLAAAGRGPEGASAAAGEVVGRRKGGGEVALEGKVAPPLPGGGAAGTTLVLRDVTRGRQTTELLCAREAHLRMLVEQMPAILWTTDTSLQITSTLGGGLAALKVRPAELIGVSMLECLGKEDVEATPIAAHLQAVRGESLSYEMEWKGRAFHVRVDPLRGPAGRVVGTVGVLLDVTDRKQAVAQIRARERQQAAVAALGLRALTGLDPARLMGEAAASVCQTLGVEFCKVLELAQGGETLRWRAGAGWRAPPRELGAGESQAAYTLCAPGPVIVLDLRREGRFRPSALLLDHGVVSGISTVIRGQDGPLGVLSAHSSRERAFGGDDVHFVQAVANTVAASLERRRAEEAKNRLLAIIEATPDVVAVAGKDGRLLYVNQAGRDLLGLRAGQDAGGRALADLFPADAGGSSLAEGIAAASARGVWSGEGTLQGRDGRRVPVSQVVLSHRDAAGSAAYLSTIARDISERQRLEEQCRQSQKMEAVGRLAGGVAHDFNNLLTIITGYGEMLLGRLTAGDPLREYAQQVHRAADRATSLTRQLLAFSRKQVLVPRPLNLNALVADMERMLRRLIGEDVELVTSLDPVLQPVWGDAGQIEQVLMNLAVNARDAMPKGGRLTVSTGNRTLDAWSLKDRPEVQPGPYVLLEVSDTGCGMSEEVKARAFEPFFTTKEVGKGTGLGLATVYGIVKQSGGHIEVESEPGRGSAFRVYLPAQGGSRPSHGAEARAAEPPGGSETVLLVEDEAAVRDLARQVLREKGYTVLEAADGAEALAVWQRHPGRIDLVLTDVVMPRVSGGALAEKVRALRPDARVLFMSGFADSALVRHGVMSGEFDCLLKPFTPVSLAGAVRQALDGPRGRVAPGGTAGAGGRAGERRAHRRRRPRAGVRVECRRGESGQGPNLAESLLDVSAEGAGVVVLRDLAEDEELALTLIPPGSGGAVRLPARVVWAAQAAGARYCAGLRFRRPLSQDELRRLA